MTDLHLPHAPLITYSAQTQHFYQWNQCESWVSSYQPSLWYSSYYKDYTCSECASSYVFCQCIFSAKREEEKEKKKPSAGHHFHWQLVNKLKQRDAGTLFLPLLTLFLSPSSAVGNWCFPQKNLLGSDVLFRWCSWWKGYIIRAGCTAKTFSFISLHPYISALALHRCGFTGMENRQSKRVNHDRLV